MPVATSGITVILKAKRVDPSQLLKLYIIKS
jgi:hypothetical protein